MKHLKKGHFFGATTKAIPLEGATLTDTEYTHDYVDWHYHENAYFTFILEGNVVERNKKETYNCSAGSLLFHHWQDAHYNIKPAGFTRGLHVELEQAWFEGFMFNPESLQGSVNITDPHVKSLFYKIFKETIVSDEYTSLVIQELLLQTFDRMLSNPEMSGTKSPAWVAKVREILHDEFLEKLTLKYLSCQLQIHPVHLSRDFSKYFHYSIGSYLRQLKIQKSLSLLPSRELSLSEIAFECGFSDQSHFVRCFKEMNGIKPSAFRKLFISA